MFPQFLTNLRIPHPGRVGGRFFISIFMPLMLDWVLGGNRYGKTSKTCNSYILSHLCASSNKML